MMAMGAIGGIASAMGAMAAGNSQANLYAYQAAVAQIQEKEAEEAAWYQYSAGEAAAQQQGLKGKQEIGQIVAAQGASGLAIGGTGPDRTQSSSYSVFYGAHETSYLAEASTNNNYAWKGWQEVADAVNFANQAGLDLFAASEARQAGEISAMADVIGGIGGAANNLSRAGQVGGSTPGLFPTFGA